MRRLLPNCIAASEAPLSLGPQFCLLKTTSYILIHRAIFSLFTLVSLEFNRVHNSRLTLAIPSD